MAKLWSDEKLANANAEAAFVYGVGSFEYLARDQCARQLCCKLHSARHIHTDNHGHMHAPMHTDIRTFTALQTAGQHTHVASTICNAATGAHEAVPAAGDVGAIGMDGILFEVQAAVRNRLVSQPKAL